MCRRLQPCLLPVLSCFESFDLTLTLTRSRVFFLAHEGGEIPTIRTDGSSFAAVRGPFSNSFVINGASSTGTTAVYRDLHVCKLHMYFLNVSLHNSFYIQINLQYTLKVTVQCSLHLHVHLVMADTPPRPVKLPTIKKTILYGHAVVPIADRIS